MKPCRFLCSLFLLLLAWERAWPQDRLPPVAAWKRGEIWKVQVVLFQSGNPQNKFGEKKAPSRFQMYITVNGKESNGLPVECWRLLFNPEKASGIDLHYFVFIGEKAGFLQGVRRVGPKENAIAMIGATEYLTLIEGPLRAFPFEVFPIDSVSATSPSPLSARVEKRTEEDRIIVEAVILGKNTDVRVRQMWVPGELYWREYERSVNGVKVLSARREEPPLAKKGVAEKKSVVLPSSVTRDDPYYLRRDPRLQAPVSVNGVNPSMESILNTLRSATNLALTIDPGLKNHTPQLGSLQINTIPSWGLMELLAAKELENGRWVRTAKGYSLTGISKTPSDRRPNTPNQPLQAPAARDNPDPTVPSQSNHWFLISGIALALIATAVASWLIYRRWAAARPLQSSQASTKPAPPAAKAVIKKKPT